MWLDMLYSRAPHVAQKIKDAMETYVVYVARRNNADPNDWGYREFRPDDPGIGGTARNYYATYTTATEEHLLAQASALTVPTANAYVSFGWYCDCDLGYQGYLRCLKIGVLKAEYAARAVYEIKEPVPHMYLDFDHVIFGQEQELIDFVVYNGNALGADQIGIIVPVMFRIASKSALNLEDSDRIMLPP